jgi:hypothetical protein
MLPAMALVGSAFVYLVFLCALGALTGTTIALLSRRKPTRRDTLVDIMVAGTAAVLAAILLAVYHSVRGLSISEPPTLIPIAVGSVLLRHVIRAFQRRR